MPGIKNALLAAMVLLVACGESMPGGGSADAKGPVTGERKLDLAGLSIGMTTSQATEVLRSAGWRVVEQKGYSWDQDVKNEVARQNAGGRRFDSNAKGVGSLVATKGDERLTVEIRSAPPPHSGRVGEVRYDAPAPDQTAQQMIAGLISRYGPPDRSGAPGLNAGATWCVAGVACAGGRGFGTRTLLLGGQGPLGMGGGLAIRLLGGSDASNARKADLARAARAAAGSTGRPSY